MIMQSSMSIPEGFSLKRTMAVSIFYGHVFKRQLLVYSLASLFFFILLLMPFRAAAQLALFTMIFSIMPLLVQFSPVVLAKSGDFRTIEYMLPAKASEKLGVFLVYFLVIIPITVYLLPELSLILYRIFPAVQTEEGLDIVNIHFSNPPIFVITNILTLASGTLTCLYVEIRCHHARVVKGILSVFAVNIGISLLGAFYGVKAAFTAGYNAAMEGKQGQAVVYDIMNTMAAETGYALFIIGVLAVYCITLVCLIYRKIKNN